VYPVMFEAIRIFLFFSLCLLVSQVFAQEKEVLRILTWEGYVTEEELTEVNQLLDKNGYSYEAQVIEPDAEGAEQMFDLIRGKQVDVAFLTLFFIKMENEQTSKLLQAIDIDSPRLENYQHLLSGLTHLPMGLNNEGQPLYIPWGGGAYGFYIDRNKVKKGSVPKSVKELWLPKWAGKFSLNKSQEWYNIGLSLMSVGDSPFLLHELVKSGEREKIISVISAGSTLQTRLTRFYANAGHFWKASPEFHDDLLIVSSWGPEISRENKAGANWQRINFEEGQMVWLDTINFVKGLEGGKLAAAEIFANYYIGKKVQDRISRELSMVAASSKAIVNKDLGDPKTLFDSKMFVPPYDNISYSIMKRMADKASQDAHSFR